MINNIDKKILFSGLAIAIAFIILGSAFKNGRPTCNRFIFNTYAYVTFMIVWIAASNLYLLDYIKTQPTKNGENNGENPTPLFITSSLNLFILLIFSLFLLYQLIKTPSSEPFRKHILLVLWLTVFSVFTTPTAQSIRSKNPQALAQLITLFLSIVVAASLFAVVFPNIIKTWWIFGLLVALIGLIIARIVFAVLGYDKTSPQGETLNMISAVIFSLFISYDTKMAVIASKICKEGNADYIRYATDLFLDFVNLFSALDDL